MAKLDVQKLLRLFKGPSLLHSELHKHGVAEPNLKTVQKWHERQRLTADNSLDILLLAKKLGHRVNILALIKKDDAR